ncbi:MAG TPA: dockerin type I domain-containing protein [Verrucomicrobiae bacterium]|nr:dockerin type I domain-containing protein [Verrucomicrobiae bacterium]
MSSRWLLALLLVPLLSSIAFSQKLIDGFTREFAIQGLPTGFLLKSFDVTGDSVSELFVITSNQLQVFDGKTFSLIFKDSTAPGTNNLNQADVNSDGSPDLIANSKDTAIVIWNGPDFSTRRFFPAPQRGFNTFAVRNREDGQVEFSFGFRLDFSISCPPSSGTGTSGYLKRYLDTTFTLADSFGLPGAPVQIEPVKIGSSIDLIIVEDDVSNQRNCDPSTFSHSLLFQRLHLGALTGSTYYSFSCFHCGPGCFLAFSGGPAIGNIDSDQGPEFIVKWEEWNSLSCTPPNPTPRYLLVYDLASNTGQFSHADSFPYLSPLFVLDINRDGKGELLSHQVIGGKPGFIEYQTSNGSTLGFTEYPFTPSTKLTGQFGQPASPKVLLGQGDSVVVFGICTAVSRGDLNADGNVTVFDVTLQLNCVFLNEGDCNLCFADVNCDGALTAADVVLELLAVFLERPFPCS